MNDMSAKSTIHRGTTKRIWDRGWLSFSQTRKTLKGMIPEGWPRYAATIVLLRPEENGRFEVLLTRRPRQMKFLGGFFVFPGGTDREEDYSAGLLKRCRGLSPADAQRILGNHLGPEISFGHWVAGVRELFEEVGVLLCATESGREINLGDEAIKQRLEQKRLALVKGTLDFGSLLESEGLVCDLSRLIYHYHRVTPEYFSMRFDTRFFLTPLPPDQKPLARSEEVTESLWIKPEDALHRSYEDEFPLIPPTSTVLENLSEIPSWEKLRARYRLP